MTTNKETLFNLIKKIDSGEIILTEGIFGIDYTKSTGTGTSVLDIFLTDTISGERIYIGRGFSGECEDADCMIKLIERRKDYLVVNDKFKENFYQEKNLDKCWNKDCANKISKPVVPVYSQTATGKITIDYKEMNIPCQDKHKRYICLDCYTNKNHD